MSEPEGFKGTPGEWFVDRGDSRLVIAAGTERIAIVGDEPYWRRFTAEDEANATLFEASKDLLAALRPFDEHAKERCADSPEWDSHNTVSIQVTIGELRAVRAAISKALQQEEGQ